MADLPTGTHAVHSIPCPERVGRRYGAARDSKVSLGNILQDLFLDREIGYGSPQLGVLLLQVLQSLGLLQLQAAVLFSRGGTSALLGTAALGTGLIKGLLGDPLECDVVDARNVC